MKYFYLFVFIVTITTSNTIIAQIPDSSPVQFNTEKDSTYYATYNKLKSLCIEKMFSPCYKKRRLMTEEYKKKLWASPDFKSSFIVKDEGALNWLKENWQSTTFKSHEAAVEEYEAIKKAALECTQQHPVYHDYMFKAILEYGPDILTDMLMEIIWEYPNQF